MAGEQFGVDTEFLRRDTVELRQNLQTLLQIRNELEEQLNIAGSMWSGPAKDAFHSQFMRDLGDFRQLCQALSEIFDNIDAAVKEYDVCDSRVRNIVDAIIV